MNAVDAVPEGSLPAHGASNPARDVSVSNGAFADPSPLAPHNARVYRFPL